MRQVKRLGEDDKGEEVILSKSLLTYTPLAISDSSHHPLKGGSFQPAVTKLKGTTYVDVKNDFTMDVLHLGLYLSSFLNRS